MQSIISPTTIDRFNELGNFCAYHEFTVHIPWIWRETFRTTFLPKDHFLALIDGPKIPILKMKKCLLPRNVERFDFWFHLPGFAAIWHGFSVGDTCLVRCKKTKKVTL